MLYDLSNPLHAESFKLQAGRLIEKRCIVELTEKKPRRTIPQNRYLWLTIGYWGAQTGYTKDEAESVYKNVNKDIFYVKKELAGMSIPYIRHIYELDMEEMSLSIERWRNWAAQNECCPVYIPSPEEYHLVSLMEMEVERIKQFL